MSESKYNLLFNSVLPIREIYNSAPCNTLDESYDIEITVDGWGGSRESIRPGEVRVQPRDNLIWIPIKENVSPDNPSSFYMDIFRKGETEKLHRFYLWYQNCGSGGPGVPFYALYYALEDGEPVLVPINLTTESGYLGITIDGTNGTIVVGDFVIDPDAPRAPEADHASDENLTGMPIFLPFGKNVAISMSFLSSDKPIKSITIQFQGDTPGPKELNSENHYTLPAFSIPSLAPGDHAWGYRAQLIFKDNDGNQVFAYARITSQSDAPNKSIELTVWGNGLPSPSNPPNMGLRFLITE